MTPLPYARPNQCRFCYSRRCPLRILSECGGYDELACLKHAAYLHSHAYQYPGALDLLVKNSTDYQRRGTPSATQAFATFRANLAEAQAFRGAG